MEFRAYPKTPRLFGEVIITEKIDGTNGLVAIDEQGVVRAGSRKRWITPEADNFGFAAWVAEHEEELRILGPGYHYGEWWGKGIQRGYGLDEKRFSLFSPPRYADLDLPDCLSVVPTIHVPPVSGEKIITPPISSENVVFAAVWAAYYLRKVGSFAARGYPRPEGVIAYHTRSRQTFKHLIDK